MNSSFRAGLGWILAGVLSGCLPVEFVEGQFSQVEVGSSGNPVCNPFGGDHGSGRTQGLWARLRYLPEDAPRYEKAGEYVRHGIDAGVDLFFNQLYTPTRPFDRGFVRQDGSVIKTEKGDTLYEWFGLHFESRLRLTEVDPPGEYQLALLSDDGSVLRIGGGATSSELIHNDGVTPSRFECASDTVTLSHESRLPIEIDYFQGPRYHISLILLWRRIEGSIPDSATCGLVGNDTFFDSRQEPPAPTNVWNGMMAEGWKVIPPENFELPESFTENPCDGGGIGT